MKSQEYVDLNDMFRSAIEKFHDKPAFSDLRTLENFSFGDVGDRIATFHKLYSDSGITSQDKIALWAPNSSCWAIAFLSVIAYGAVAVPILNEFTPADAGNLLEHSESKILFTTKSLYTQLDPVRLESVVFAIDIENNFDILFSNNNPPLKTEIKETGEKVDNETILKHFDGSHLALINYTSGSTGNPKGVMLSRRAVVSNVVFALEHMPFLHEGDGILSMLPLAHMYGMLVEMIFPFAKGAHVSFLGRTPSPQILLAAFEQVKPRLIITVPLVIEKIINTRIFPIIEKGLLSILYNFPVTGFLIKRNIRRKLLSVFGGSLHEMIIGGSGLDPKVENFLTQIKFPFTVGYGMTECAPLIAYAPWNGRAMGSCGTVVDRMEARIESPDPTAVPGELLVRGANVMDGYYKNHEATANVLSKDGWMRTGDIVQLDDKGFLHIKGRSKTMILGASGQNIYPEEIEAVLNRLPYVAESLIVGRESKLVALIVADADEVEKAGISDEQLKGAMQANIENLNGMMPVYSKISAFELMAEPFAKTPKHSIKRFLYQ